MKVKVIEFFSVYYTDLKACEVHIKFLGQLQEKGERGFYSKIINLKKLKSIKKYVYVKGFKERIWKPIRDKYLSICQEGYKKIKHLEDNLPSEERLYLEIG